MYYIYTNWNLIFIKLITSEYISETFRAICHDVYPNLALYTYVWHFSNCGVYNTHIPSKQINHSSTYKPQCYPCSHCVSSQYMQTRVFPSYTLCKHTNFYFVKILNGLRIFWLLVTPHKNLFIYTDNPYMFIFYSFFIVKNAPLTHCWIQCCSVIYIFLKKPTVCWLARLLVTLCLIPL